jgi:hypothetical protein
MTETTPVFVLAGNPAQPPYPLYTSQRLSVSPTIHRNDQHPALYTHPVSPVLSMHIRRRLKALIVGLVTPATRH